MTSDAPKQSSRITFERNGPLKEFQTHYRLAAAQWLLVDKELKPIQSMAFCCDLGNAL